MSDSHNPSAVSLGSTSNFLSHWTEKVIHPSTSLAEMLLRKVLMIPLRHFSLAKILKHPGADVAVVHDDHWGAIIGEVRWFTEFFSSKFEPSSHLCRTRTE